MKYAAFNSNAYLHHIALNTTRPLELAKFYEKFNKPIIVVASTRYEHPFTDRDLALLKNKYKNVEIKYYGFLTLIFFPFYLNPNKSKIFKILKNADQILFKIKLFRYFAWSILISAKK